jgi:hypothetical protein
MSYIGTVNATISIPTLHCTEQYDEHGNSEPYLWIAYIKIDETSLSDHENGPVYVFVPSVSDTRALYPDNIGNNTDIDIPVEMGRFQTTVALGDLLGSTFGALGVLAVLFEEDDTSGDAIAAGYDAFRTAVGRELNYYVKKIRLGIPTADELSDVVSKITDSVTSAIKDKLGWTAIFDDPDDYIGYSLAIFAGDQLVPEPDPIRATATSTIEMQLPPIDADVLYQRWPGEFEKIGHNHYEFPGAQLVLTSVDLTSVDPGFSDSVKAFNVAVGTLKSLRDQRNKLKVHLAKAPENERASIRKEIEDLKTSKIPEAVSALEAVAQGLRPH